MPNLRNAKKEVRKNLARYTVNKKVKARVSRWIKETESLVQDKAKKKAVKAVSTLSKLIDKAAKEHVISANKAARVKSRVQKAVNTL